MITTIIFVTVIFFAWYKPPVAIALLLQTHVVRSLAQFKLKDPCYHCLMEPDMVLGAILPIIAFIIILIRTGTLSKKIMYPLDKFDALIGMILIALFIGTLLSYSILDSFNYSLRFVFLALPYYLIVKLYFVNARKNLQREMVIFLKTSFYLAFAFGIFALFIVWFNDDNIGRITIPRVHPIPYSQLIGLGVLVCAIILMTKKYRMFYKYRSSNNIVIVLFVILLIIQLATNTRGVLVSLIFSLLFIIYYNPVTIKRSNLYLGVLGVLVVLILVLSQLDFYYYFRRISEFTTDQSISDRVKVYGESFEIFYETRFLGTGPGAFQQFSFLDYPHNLFLENLAVFGALGIILNLYIILIIAWLLVNLQKWRSDILLILSIGLFLFYFVETMFSFTLWMHKGLYLSMALISVNYYYHKLNQHMNGQLH